jgi:copper homeostasis protein CutC
MSVLMILRVSGDPKAVEATDQAVFQTVIERAQALGATKHRFFTNGSEVLVVDEWPDQASFQQFFDSSPEIPEIMAAAGVTAPPVIEFWDRMSVDDAFGWD